MFQAGLIFRATTRKSLLVGRNIATTSSKATAAAAAGAPSSTEGPDKRVVRWGIMSAGKISSDYAKAIDVTEGCVAHAVAARREDRARSFAEDHGVSVSYGSYRDLVEDPDVDVVYVGSVADQHKALAEMSLSAGKPTVVEKPLTLSYKDSAELIRLAESNDTFLMEGMWTRCFPAMIKLRDLIGRGVIGRPFMVQGDFGWSTEGCAPQDRIWFEQSGGMTLDIGMYMAQLGQVAYGSQCRLEHIQAMGSVKNGVDHTAAVNCKYDFQQAKDGQDEESSTGFLQFYVTGDANTEERVCIQGTKGRIIVESPAHVPQKLCLELDEGRGVQSVQTMEFPLPDDGYTTWNYPGSIGFTHQIRVVNDCVRDGLLQCPHYTWDDSLQVSAVLDVVRSDVMHEGKKTSSDKVAAQDEAQQVGAAAANAQ